MTGPDIIIAGEVSSDTTRQINEVLSSKPGEPVVIEINSAGGGAFDGLSGFNAIRQHGRVTTSVTGLAASAAATIALGGATIRMHRSAMMMVHSASMITVGNSAEHRKSTDVLDKLDVEYTRLVAEVTGHPEARVRAWLEAETWMTAEEAVDLNFADEVIDAGEADLAPVAKSQRELLQKFRNLPDELASLKQAARSGPPQGADE